MSDGGEGRLVPRRARDEKYGPRSILHVDESVAAIVSLFVAVAAAFVIVFVDTWLGIALAAIACALYFVLSALSIGASRRRVQAQIEAFGRKRRHQRRWR